MRALRPLVSFLTVAALVFTLGQGDAFAKKEKKEKTPTSELVSIEMCGVAEADTKVFEPAKQLHDTLNEIETNLTSGNAAFVSALGITEGTPFADALASLKTTAGDKLTVAMDGAMPKVSVQDGVPDNVKAAVDSLNVFIDAHVKAIDLAKDLPTQAQALVAAAQSLDPAALAQQAAANPMEIPKVLKTINNNLSAIKTTPDRVTNVTGTLTTNVDAIKGLGS